MVVWSNRSRDDLKSIFDYIASDSKFYAQKVVNMIVDRAESLKHDYKMPLKYGVDQCIGDTLGPGGIFRALRSIPVII